MLDKIRSGALPGISGGQGAANPTLQIIGSPLGRSGGSGRLAGLIQPFHQAGFGEHMQSWIGSGQNLPISMDQLSQVFGADRMQKMAAGAGMDKQPFGGQLTELLPRIGNLVTPTGEAPSGGVDDALGMLSKLTYGPRLAGGRPMRINPAGNMRIAAPDVDATGTARHLPPRFESPAPVPQRIQE